MNASMTTNQTEAHESALSAYLHMPGGRTLNTSALESLTIENLLNAERGATGAPYNFVKAALIIVDNLIHKNRDLDRLARLCARETIFFIKMVERSISQQGYRNVAKKNRQALALIPQIIREYESDENEEALTVIAWLLASSMWHTACQAEARERNFLEFLGRENVIVFPKNPYYKMAVLWDKPNTFKQITYATHPLELPPYVLKLYDLLYSPVVRAPRAPELNSDSAHVRRLSEYIRVA